MKLHTYLLIVAIFALAISQAIAAPSHFGPTGLIAVPTTEVVEQSQVNFGAFFTSVDDNDCNYFTANMGIAKSLEVGATLIDPEFGSSETIINAKYQLTSETTTVPSLAIGLVDATDQIDSSAYLVLGKSLSLDSTSIIAPKIYVGVGNGYLDGIFAGATAALGSRTQIMAEYDADNFNYGARFALNNELRLDVSMIDTDNLSVGFSFNKGF